MQKQFTESCNEGIIIEMLNKNKAISTQLSMFGVLAYLLSESFVLDPQSLAFHFYFLISVGFYFISNFPILAVFFKN